MAHSKLKVVRHTSAGTEALGTIAHLDGVGLANSTSPDRNPETDVQMQEITVMAEADAVVLGNVSVDGGGSKQHSSPIKGTVQRESGKHESEVVSVESNIHHLQVGAGNIFGT